MYKDSALSETATTFSNKLIQFHESQFIVEKIDTNHTIMKKYKFVTMQGIQCFIPHEMKLNKLQDVSTEVNIY